MAAFYALYCATLVPGAHRRTSKSLGKLYVILCNAFVCLCVFHSVSKASTEYPTGKLKPDQQKLLKGVYMQSEWCLRCAAARPAVGVSDMHELKEQTNAVLLPNSHTPRASAYKSVAHAAKGDAFNSVIMDYILAKLDSPASGAWRKMMQCYMDYPGFINERFKAKGELDTLLVLFEGEHS